MSDKENYVVLTKDIPAMVARIASLERDHKLMREALDEIIGECPNPKLPYGARVNDLARTALSSLLVKDGE